MKRIYLSVVFILIIAIYYYSNNSENNFRSGLPFNPEWEVPSSEEQLSSLATILNQPFTYVGEGGQSIVFESADNRYVLKFFKFKRFRPYLFVHYLPDVFPFKNFKEKHTLKRFEKLITAFNGYTLAYKFQKIESGLIFVQLNPFPFKREITLIDKKNRKNHLNLENSSFILQRKGEMFSDALTRILDQGNIPLAKQLISQLFTLYLSEYKKGLRDNDYGIMHNIGYIDNHLFHLDPGKLIQDQKMQDPVFQQKDIIKIAAKLKKWLDNYYPQYSNQFDQNLVFSVTY